MAERWKTPMLLLNVFSSLKAAQERAGKQWEINDSPAVGTGRTSQQRQGKGSVSRGALVWGSADRELDSHPLK